MKALLPQTHKPVSPSQSESNSSLPLKEYVMCKPLVSQSRQGNNEPTLLPSHKVMHHKLALVMLQEAPWKPQKYFALGMSIAKVWKHTIDDERHVGKIWHESFIVTQ